MTLDVDEFLRRFLLHLLPPGFVRIRNFGFLANRNRASLLPRDVHLFSGAEKMTASLAAPSTDQTHSLSGTAQSVILKTVPSLLAPPIDVVP